MHINEAVKGAAENDLCIARKNAWWGEHLKIKPTDTSDCCLIIPQEGHVDPIHIGKRWNPSKEDLLAEDWIVTE